ncbi:viroplasmin family protein [Shewanella intestini]|uniref:ribonuclease H n=1 Tax=Shewanella intestini TaxID=2017544 RepID=A0ABS5I3V4_9GAMM|nr:MULTISPECIES: ribonuclease H family protein [Shewanella]MBR9727985.1 ribonuclease HI [Shewanella intestini]MRG36464.1 ribonuclease HI [Shewanella sp. XMDDZSB0408]
MAKKFYVVWQGRQPGIYDNWNEAKQQVDKFAGAKYKSFPSFAEAKSAFSQTASANIGKAPQGRKNSASGAKTTKDASTKKADNQAILNNFDVVIYTDGGCEPNPGKAGSGVAVYQQGELSSLWFGLYNPNGTNNTAELNALHQALLMAKQALEAGKTVQVLTDSQYSLNCVSNWAYGWKAKGWVKKSGEIANLGLIKLAHDLYDSMKDQLVIEHVSAHIGIEGNELADRMSIYAVDKQQTEFVAYPQPFELSQILALRAG